MNFYDCQTKREGCQVTEVGS